MDPGNIPAVPSLAALAEAAHYIKITQTYFCDAIVIWDWIISLPKEWKFIWKSPSSPVKFLYLFCRYWVIAVMPYILWVYTVDHSKEACQKLYRSPVALGMWNQIGAEAVLLVRTYAFMGRKVWTLVLLVIALCGVGAYQLFAAMHEILLLPFVVPPFTQGPCLPMSKLHSAHILGFFMAPLAFDSMVTIPLIIRAVQIRRQGGGHSPLIQTFLREGVFYFLLISIANLINGIFYLQPQQSISALNIPLSLMFPDVLACRMILDLRTRGNSSLEVSLASRPVAPNYSGKSARDTSRLALGSQTKYASGVPRTTKASRVLGTQLYATADSFDSPIELGHVQLDEIKRTAKTFAASDTVLDVNGEHDDLGGIKIEVERHVT